MRVLSPSSTPSSRAGCRYPRSGRGMTMVPPDVRQRGRDSRIAMRRWNSRMTMMKPLLLPRVSSCVLIPSLVLNSHRHSPSNNTASLCPATLYEPAPRSHRRRSIRPVPTVRSLISIRPPCMYRPFVGSDTGDCNPYESLYPQLQMPPVSRSKWLKSCTRRLNWLQWPRKIWMGSL